MTDDRFNNPYFDPNAQGSDSENINNDVAEPEVLAEPVNTAQEPMAAGVTPEPPVTDLFDVPEPNQANPYSASDTQPVQDVQDSATEPVSAVPDTSAPYSCEWYGGTAQPTPPYSPQHAPAAVPKKERKKKGVSRGGFIAGLAICLCLSFVAGFAGTAVFNYIESLNTEIKNGLTINRVDSEDADSAYKDGGLSTVEIVSKAADSVVEITTETVTTGIFAQQYIQSGAGSGVIVDAEGFIVTNHHVIDGATNITVTLRGGTSFDAELVGSDEELDIALVKIEPTETLTPATFGDSDKLMVGERTVAIGNPLGQLGGSVTEGIISALNRDVVIDDQTMSLLQTDTAINPGNSGGGLFDSYGNLVGIVNAKSSGSEVEGLGFAIPINDVINVIGDLSEYGYVRGRVDLGMTFIDVDSEQLAWMYGLDETGCYIYSVDSGTNADVAGFESGDKVVSINGTEVNTSDEVEEIIENCAVGEEVTFAVKNTSGRTYKISLVLEEYVPENKNFFENNNSGSDNSHWWSYYN